MRLDRYLSQATGYSRSEVLSWIRAGRVLVDGAVIRDAGAHVVPGKHTITADTPGEFGAVIQPPGHRYLMLHKPKGYVSTTEEGANPIVLDLVPAQLAHRDLAPVGRLDKDTTGLLILTSDGTFNHALTAPKRHVEKAYLADLDLALPADAVGRFAAGMALADGTVCQPAVLEILEPLRVRIVLREGRYHQVKRMVAKLGSTVVGLHRERIGGLWLDPDLAPGQLRPLTAKDVKALGIGPWDLPQ